MREWLLSVIARMDELHGRLGVAPHMTATMNDLRNIAGAMESDAPVQDEALTPSMHGLVPEVAAPAQETVEAAEIAEKAAAIGLEADAPVAEAAVEPAI